MAIRREAIHWRPRPEGRGNGIRVAVDYGNGVAAITASPVFRRLGLRMRALFPNPDGRFPAHDPNPHDPKNFRPLIAELKRGIYDLGVFFDGDGDRAILFDRWGTAVRPDITAGILAVSRLPYSQILKNLRIKRRDCAKAPRVLHDLRFSRAVVEEIRRAGGKTVRMPVGTPYYKDRIPEDADVLMGAELSGHIMLREFHGIDDGLYAVLAVLGVMAQRRKHLDELALPFRRYAQSGEQSLRVIEPEAALRRLARHYRDGKRSTLDGLTIEYPEWWCNIRVSNTEPLVRLNVEAENPRLLKKRLAELLRILKSS